MLTNEATRNDVLEGPDLIEQFRVLSIDVDLSALQEDQRRRVKKLLYLAHAMAAQLEAAVSEEKAMDAFGTFYENISKQIDENQKRFQQASDYLYDYTQRRRDSLTNR